MRRVACALAISLLALASPSEAAAQAMDVVEPYKVGTFEIAGEPTVSLVLRDRLIVGIEAANRALEMDPTYARMPMPADMLGLIGQYEYGLKYRLYEIVNDLVGNNRLAGAGRAAYVHDLGDVRTLAPILYPGKVLNAAGNFYSHVGEGGGAANQQATADARRENRGVPYLFLKPTRGAIVGNGTPITIPYGRDRIDWEVEIGTVIGRAAKYVQSADAEAHVFGYMVTIDVSDRGGRPPGNRDTGGDWYVGKGHDTFAPQGPWIVPKEFYGNPMENLRQTLTVDGRLLQEARAGDMIHSLWELIEYASSINTLYPGDVVNGGTSGGTGMGVVQTGTAEWLQAGDVIEATVDGIGTLRMPVVSEDAPPGPVGVRLPPVNSYRPIS
ncbi:MAG: fumarylacetoacetate hydrolase family protein [Gemmatimonadota bacterium]|nr:fumarylacetoacetate hydrolase family protein [Gemmatimonadota bacterium]